jgi:penicillin amidase
VASVRSTSLEPGGVAYLSCLNYLGARSADEYRQGLSHWVLPVTNHVFADTDGYMQWQVAGLIPQRNNANGAVPTLGDGSHDWLGFSPFAHNAHRDIGPNEFFTTSNEYNLHSDRPRRAHDEGMDWPTPDRHLRLTELLSSRRNWDIESTKRVQSDVLDIRAREICRTLNDMVDDIPKPIDPKKPHYGNAMKAWRRLSTWDGTMDAACMEPLLFEVWSQRHLCPKLLGRYLLSILPESQCDAAFRRITELSNGHYDPRTLSSLFHDLTASPDCIGIILDTLQEAWQELCRAYGPNEHAWAWGRFHISSLSHLLDGHTQSSWPGLPARGLPGDFSTVCLGAYDQHGVHSVGPGWRMIFDVGDWDDDVQVLMPGQSGDPRSRHYRDQADAWYQGRYTPMHFSTDTSSASEWERITLVASPPLPRTDMHTI